MKLGRPRQGTELKDILIGVRVDKTMRARIEKEAEKRHLSITELVMKAIINELREAE